MILKQTCKWGLYPVGNVVWNVNFVIWILNVIKKLKIKLNFYIKNPMDS